MLNAIYGCGGFGREVYDWYRGRWCRKQDDPNQSICFISDDELQRSKTVNGIQVLSLDSFAAKEGEKKITIAIGNSKVREALLARCIERKIFPFEIQHHTSVVSPLAGIGYGAVFSPFSVLCPNAHIGKLVHLNMYAYVAHDAVLGDFCTLAPRASINGNVVLGDHVYVGTGAVIREGIKVGAHSVIGAGAVVVKDVGEWETVVGVPAVPISSRKPLPIVVMVNGIPTTEDPPSLR